MTNSASSLMAIIFGLAVFAVIVAVGWRSVQNRRIMRLQGGDGKETIIVAGENDEVSSIAISSDIPSSRAVASSDAQRARLDRVVSSTK